MKIRYTILPTLMISTLSFPVYSIPTVTTYQDLAETTTFPATIKL